MALVVVAPNGGFLDGAVDPTWPLVQGWFGLVRRCLIPCSRQMRVEHVQPVAGPSGQYAVRGYIAERMPLSVSTMWMGVGHGFDQTLARSRPLT